MTREEAITRYNAIKARGDFCEYLNKEMVEMAIQALSQEPCDDAISRILKRMWNCRGKHTTSIDKVAMEQIIRDELSVTQKPIECDDAISRQAVLDGLKECMCEDWVKTLFATMVKQLPSVTPSRHKGHWLRVTTVNPKEFCNRCSECGYEQFYAERYKFCPNCGAKMESEE